MVDGKTTAAEVLALIPARSGSKGIPNKNIRSFLGKPLLVHSIDHALSAQTIDRVVVSTNSQEYREISRNSGAEVPFLRPEAISQDNSTDLEVFAHALSWLAAHEGYRPDICVHLRPTCPVRNTKEINVMVDLLIQRPDADSVRTISKSSVPPHKMWFLGEAGFLEPILAPPPSLEEPWNAGRQLLPQGYYQTASIDVVRTGVIQNGSMTGKNILPFLQEDMYDIDTELELQTFEDRARRHVFTQTPGVKTFVVDIDGVLAGLVPNNDYAAATPIVENIQLLNCLYEAGHIIVLFTARGSETGIDWTDHTKAQMAKWGVRFHRLAHGKPAADFYIDDRAVTPGQLRALVDLCCD